MTEGWGAYGLRSSQRKVFLAISAIIAAIVVVAANAVMLPFVLALVVAYVLTPAVRRVERARVPRWAAILIVYALTLGSVGYSISVIVPRLVIEGQALGAEWPRLTQKARDEVLPAIDAKLAAWSGRPPEPEVPALIERDDTPAPLHVTRRPDGSLDVEIQKGVQLREVREGVWQLEQVEAQKGVSSAAMIRAGFEKAVSYLRENSLEVLKLGQQVVAFVSRGIFNLFMTLMLAAYMMLTHEKIIHFFRELWTPASRESFDRFMRRLDRGLSGVVRGQLLICLVNGVLSAIGFWLFDLKYWPILAIVAAIMSVIPIFGSILSSVPAVAIGLTQSFGTALGVLAWIIGIHQLEANFLNPKIIGDAAKIHPVLVVFSLLVGEHFAGITGALFAVPCMSIAQTIFLHFRESTLGLADPMASIRPPAPAIKTPATPAPAVSPDEPAPDTARAP